MKYLKLFNTHAEYVAFTQTEDFIKPNVTHCVQEDDVHYNPYDYSDRYLTFIALENGTFTFRSSYGFYEINYSIDNGETWTAGDSVNVSNGDKVMWKGKILKQAVDQESIGTFRSTCNFDVQGNIMSLLYGDNFEGQTDLTEKDKALSELFSGCTKLINAKNLSLPATTLTNGCYDAMFINCTNLVTAPSVLPATTLTDTCYNRMFFNCTSLTTAPALPAVTLANRCYDNMFGDCTSLITAPILPATTLVSYCYQYMFKGCTKLNYIKAMFTTEPSTTYTNGWVDAVASNGTFVKNVNATWTTTGVNGIPSGWTVRTASA